MASRALVVLAHLVVVLLPSWMLHRSLASLGIALLWVAAWTAEASASWSATQPANAAEQRRSLLLLVVAWACTLTAEPRPVTWMLGAAVVVIGVSLRRSAILALGDRFVASVRPAGALVRTGPYAWLRHPSEWGLVLIAAGVALAAGSWVGAAACAALVALPACVRARAEDAYLWVRVDDLGGGSRGEGDRGTSGSNAPLRTLG